MEKEIKFEGNYWHGDSQNVTTPLEKELHEILGTTRVSHIVIHGCDFNDGKQNHKIEIEICKNKIIISDNS